MSVSTRGRGERGIRQVWLGVRSLAVLALVAPPSVCGAHAARAVQDARDGEGDPALTAETAADPRTPGTLAMVARLAALPSAPGMDRAVYNNHVRARLMAAELEALPGKRMSDERIALEFALGIEWLRGGEMEKAIEILDRLQAFVEGKPERFTLGDRYEMASQAAIAHLRFGELENCIARHGVDSCLMPIRGGGVHVDERGSRGAIERYESMLRKYSQDLRARWTLNLAYMTLEGGYPDRVPPEWAIPPAAFASEYELPRFFNVAAQAGLDMDGLSGGCVVDDLDGDDDLDVMASSMWLTDQTRYFENVGDGTFVDRTERAGLLGITGGLNLTAGDYDNDGRLDVLVLRGGWWTGESGRQPNSLLHNEGGGRFSDVTESAGVLSYHPTQAGAFGDYDNDGWLDLFVGNESAPGFQHVSELYHNDGDGTFTEVARQVGLAVDAFVKGAVWGDYDNDGRLDLYVSCNGSANRLYHNEGLRDGRFEFENVADKAGVTEPLMSFPTWFFDFDNDGWQDIFVSDFVGDEGHVAADYLRGPDDALPTPQGRPCIYKNNRDGTFTNVARRMGVYDVILTMGCNYGDLDNDGWLDFYLATGNPDFRTLVPNRMFRNDGGKRFQDVTTAGGFGHLQKGHAVSFSDLDDDGDQDVYVVLGGAYESDMFTNALFENPGSANRWIALRLEGTTSNRSALGARLRVSVRTPAGTRDIHRTVSTGGSFGVSSLRLPIGLGDATAIEKVEITWPTTGRVQVVEGLELDRMYRVREGVPAAEPLAAKRVALGGAQAAHEHGSAHELPDELPVPEEAEE